MIPYSKDTAYKTAALGGGSKITDVQIDDASIVEDKVAKIPLADADTFGVVKVGEGLSVEDGVISAEGGSSYTAGTGIDISDAGVITTKIPQKIGGTKGLIVGTSVLGAPNYATGVGYDVELQGSNSVGVGFKAATTGSYTIAIGDDARANGQYNIAIGKETRSASGARSIAIGLQTTTTGTNNIAIGTSSKAQDTNTICINASGAAATAQAGTPIIIKSTDTAKIEVDSSGNLNVAGLTDGTTTKTMTEVLAGGGGGGSYTFTNGLTETDGTVSSDLNNVIKRYVKSNKDYIQVLSADRTTRTDSYYIGAGTAGSELILWRNLNKVGDTFQGIHIGENVIYPGQNQGLSFGKDDRHCWNLFADGGLYSNNGNTTFPKVVTAANAVGTAPTSDGNYVLKCTVTGGVPTYTWVAE